MFSVNLKFNKQELGQLVTKKGQVMLEFVFNIIIIMVFLIACFNALIWAGKMFVERQNAYENSRSYFYAPEVYVPENMVLTPKM